MSAANQASFLAQIKLLLCTLHDHQLCMQCRPAFCMKFALYESPVNKMTLMQMGLWPQKSCLLCRLSNEANNKYVCQICIFLCVCVKEVGVGVGVVWPLSCQQCTQCTTMYNSVNIYIYTSLSSQTQHTRQIKTPSFIFICTVQVFTLIIIYISFDSDSLNMLAFKLQQR